ncbi:SRPBCC family protein [Streptomyces sp. NPDC006624]|uniref:SRPBCC family protein n=1 Tax=Streptomyces sp. NPDC006624 TaxID=3154892 RepID=UPI0033BC03E2
MDWNRYRFRSLWPLPAPPATVYEVLARPEDYPRWWRAVREVNRLDDTTGVIRIRSVLPYDITFTAREVRRDPAAGVLEIAMTGDLEGWARWTVTADGAGSLARYDQVVTVTKPLMRRLAVPGRPVFRANHALMMRSGRRGLAGHLRAV